MLEITVSRARKHNLGNYESEDIFCAVKSQVLDTENVAEKLVELNKDVKFFVEEESKKIKKGGSEGEVIR